MIASGPAADKPGAPSYNNDRPKPHLREYPAMTQNVGKPAGPARMFGPEMLANPYPIYALLRSMDPVHWQEVFQGWVLTRYADVATLLRSPHVSSERAAAAGGGRRRNSMNCSPSAPTPCSTPTRPSTPACARW